MRTGLKLYGSSDKYFGEDEEDAVEGVETPVIQNGNRADYVYNINLGGIALSNYSYSFKDESAKTYVMTYAVNDEGFVKTDERCPKDCQCFENAAKDKRLIVPPYEVSFNHCKALPEEECSYDPNSLFHGIMVAVKKNDEWISLALGGEITRTADDDDDLEYTPVLAHKGVVSSRMSNRYLNYDGNSVYKRHQSTYLPANIILLGR